MFDSQLILNFKLFKKLAFYLIIIQDDFITWDLRALY